MDAPEDDNGNASDKDGGNAPENDNMDAPEDKAEDKAEDKTEDKAEGDDYCWGCIGHLPVQVQITLIALDCHDMFRLS